MMPIPSVSAASTISASTAANCRRSAAASIAVSNARGAIVWYDSALAAQARGDEAPELRETCHALWHNKAVAHQQLREFVEAKEAELHAQRLSAR